MADKVIALRFEQVRTGFVKQSLACRLTNHLVSPEATLPHTHPAGVRGRDTHVGPEWARHVRASP